MEPETRETLILRLADAEDASAWELFLAVYEPMLYRLARRWGLQDADAHDLVQEVLVAVSRSIESYEQRGGASGFRSWLAEIARHKFADLLTRRKRQAVGSGQTDVHLWLSQLPDKSAVSGCGTLNEVSDGIWSHAHLKLDAQNIKFGDERVAGEESLLGPRSQCCFFMTGQQSTESFYCRTVLRVLPAERNGHARYRIEFSLLGKTVKASSIEHFEGLTRGQHHVYY